MKIIGLLLIFCSFSVLGFYISEKSISVLKDIERTEMFIKNVLICLKNEHMTVSNILDFAAEYGDKKTKTFVKEYKSNKNLSLCEFDESKRILDEVFSVLGKYSINDQIREIEFCRNKIKNLYESNLKTQKEKAKFCRKAGVLCGMLVAILFI